MWLLLPVLVFHSLVWCAEIAPQFIVIVSANAEWRIVRELNPGVVMERSPYGEFFLQRMAGVPVVILQGGWGKVDAAASAQYAIDRWHPRGVFNLGTCGGMAGHITKYEIVLAERTVIYDIVEMMGDSSEAIRDYATVIDLAWLGPKLPTPVRRATLVSADRDLAPADIPKLRRLYGAVAADWESGAIARVAVRNAGRRHPTRRQRSGRRIDRRSLWQTGSIRARNVRRHEEVVPGITGLDSPSLGRDPLNHRGRRRRLIGTTRIRQRHPHQQKRQRRQHQESY